MPTFGHTHQIGFRYHINLAAKFRKKQNAHLNSHWAVNHWYNVIKVYLSYKFKVFFIHKYWYLTNLWLEIYQNLCVYPNMDIWFLAHNSANFCPIKIRRLGPTSREIRKLGFGQDHRFEQSSTQWNKNYCLFKIVSNFINGNIYRL